jgi:hypothetical protein
MRRKIITLVEGTAVVACALACSAAAGQDAPAPLVAQLKAQYQLAKMCGGEVCEKGTVLAIQKGGILGVGQLSILICPSKYQDGDLHTPSAICAASVKATSRYFKQGEKVYPTKIEVNLKKDHVSLFIVSCDECNGINPPTYYKSDVIFQFAKGSLGSATVPQITDAIGQVFSIDTSGGAPAQAATADTQASTPQAPDPPPAEPVHVQLGQTPDQVQASLGRPDKVIDLGAKQIYVYKDLKVTFLNGKVSDVQ